MTTLTVRAVAPMAALLLSGCDFGDWAHGNAGAFRADFHESRAMKPGSTLLVENYNGAVEILAWDQDKVDIAGEKYGATEELRDGVRIEIEDLANGLRVRTVRPPDRRRGASGAKYIIKVPRRTKLESIGSSNGPVRINNVEGDVRVRTSNATVEVADVNGALDLVTSNARIRASNVRGGFSARTSNGGVRADIVETQSTVRVATSNGSVELTFAKPPSADIFAESSNGGLTLGLPSATNARLRAKTSNGSVTTEHDLTVSSGTIGKSRVEGTIGSGGPVIDLDTSNGRIRIERR